MRHGRRSGHGGGSRAYDTDVPVQFVRKEFANGTQRRPWTEFLFPSLSLSLWFDQFVQPCACLSVHIYLSCLCLRRRFTNEQTDNRYCANRGKVFSLSERSHPGPRANRAEPVATAVRRAKPPEQPANIYKHSFQNDRSATLRRRFTTDVDETAAQRLTRNAVLKS